MKKPIRFLLVGCGRIAARHAAIIRQTGTLAAVCDIDQVKALQFAATNQTVAFDDLYQMLGQIQADVLVVCTPNGLHAVHSIAGLNAGLHVLCEKPMALSVIDCQLMMEAAERNQRRLYIVKQNRFNPPVQAVRKLLQEDQLGSIYSVQLNCVWNRDVNYYQNSWKGTLDMDGGILFTQFSHFIDLLWWFLGDVDAVQAMFSNQAHQQCIEFEDTAVAVLHFKRGTLASLHFSINSFNKNMEGSLLLVGEKGTVKIGGQYLNELDYQEISGSPIGSLPKGRPANEYGSYQGSMSNHQEVYDDFLRLIQAPADEPTNAFDAMKTVEIIEQIYSSRQ